MGRKPKPDVTDEELEILAWQVVTTPGRKGRGMDALAATLNRHRVGEISTPALIRQKSVGKTWLKAQLDSAGNRFRRKLDEARLKLDSAENGTGIGGMGYRVSTADTPEVVAGVKEAGPGEPAKIEDETTGRGD